MPKHDWIFTEKSRKKPKIGEPVWIQAEHGKRIMLGMYTHLPAAAQGPNNTTGVRVSKKTPHGNGLTWFYWKGIRAWCRPVKPEAPK